MASADRCRSLGRLAGGVAPTKIGLKRKLRAMNSTNPASKVENTSRVRSFALSRQALALLAVVTWSGCARCAPILR